MIDLRPSKTEKNGGLIIIQIFISKYSYNNIMKKYSEQDQKSLVSWAADCAQRVLPFLEKAYPLDGAGRARLSKPAGHGVRTGVFKMADIRGASLAAHAAARVAKENNAACFAARAAGQGVATAHVPQHAYGAAYYALKAIGAADPANAEVMVAKELKWQTPTSP